MVNRIWKKQSSTHTIEEAPYFEYVIDFYRVASRNDFYIGSFTVKTDKEYNGFSNFTIPTSACNIFKKEIILLKAPIEYLINNHYEQLF